MATGELSQRHTHRSPDGNLPLRQAFLRSKLTRSCRLFEGFLVPIDLSDRAHLP